MDNKQRITEEAAVLFRTYGIRAVTMDMLASQMGISKRTIYETFHDKDEILQEVLVLMKTRQVALISKILKDSGNVIEAIFKIIDHMMDHFRNMSPAFQMDIKRYHNEFLRETERSSTMSYYRSNIEILNMGIKEGLFRQDLNVEITNIYMTEVLRMINDRELFPPDYFLQKDILRNIFISFLRGISTIKGIENIDKYDKIQ